MVVIGGGPAGMMAAGQAARAGVSTLLVEKMDRPGRKLQITGKGRCNLTNTVPVDEFIRHFNRKGRFLYSAFSRFFTQDLIEFFNKLDVKTKVERGGRVFPASDEAKQIVDALVDWTMQQGVEFVCRSKAEEISIKSGAVDGLWVSGLPDRSSADEQRSDGSCRISCSTLILATGGVSYPGTGSTGDGYRLAQSVGHILVPIRPALIPLDAAGDIPPRLEGLALRNVRASLLIDGKRDREAFGEMLFTQFGISGPIILSISRAAVDAFDTGSLIEVAIDLKPALDDQKLDARLQRDIINARSKHFKTLLKGLLPRKLIPVCIDMVGIPADTPSNQITAVQRRHLCRWLKDFRLEIEGHRPIAQAIVTAGGIDTQEIDPRTMQSRLVSGLFFAGEILDVDADTGGYNLQAAFSTGWLAGRSAASALGFPRS